LKVGKKGEFEVLGKNNLEIQGLEEGPGIIDNNTALKHA